MAVSEKSEQAGTPEEQQVEKRDSADNREHRGILSAAEAAQQDAVHIKLSWRSWVSLACSEIPVSIESGELTSVKQVVVFITCFAQVDFSPTRRSSY